jgi:PPK2 family polyphosphate:nucleotide phosphotransferase
MAEIYDASMPPWRIPAGHAVDLATIDPAAVNDAPGDKDATVAAFKQLRHELREWQRALYAERKQALLVVFQAIDGGGKDSTIRKVFMGVNPQGCRVTSFKQPTERELAHDFLWRVHAATPEKGEIGIFNRSHYEDVLVVRVHELVPESVWRDRYRIINDFEHNLAAAGTRIVKFLLHISRDEQERRFESRQSTPEKRWKWNPADEAEAKHWDDYQAAFADAVEKTSTDEAPWFVIPANHKWYRNWAVATVLAETLREMNPQYPEAVAD